MFPPPSSHGTFAFDAMLIAARGAAQVCAHMCSSISFFCEFVHDSLVCMRELAQEYQANAFAALTSSAMNVSMNARIRSQAHTGITGPIRFVSAFTDRFGQSRAWYVGQMQSTSVGGNDLSLIEVATFDANLVASVDLNRLKSAGANSNPQCAGGNQWMSAASFATFSASPIAQSSPSVAFGHGTPFAVSVSRNSGVCIPCAFGFYSVASVCVACPPGTLCPLATATPVPVDTAFVLGSLAPSADSGNASASFTGSMFAVELGARDTNTLAFEHGPIVSPQTLREIQLSYLYSVAGVAFVICLVFVAFVCMSRVDECKRLRALLRKADIVFTTDHPTRVGRPVMKRKTSIGGFCAIVFVLTVSLVTAVLVHSWSASYYSIVADFQSYLIVPGAGAVETSDFIIEAHFLGVDLSLACAHACESVIGAASSDELPTFETMSAASSFTSPFTSSLPRTFSTRADRTACIAVTDAAAAAAIGCGAFSASSRAIGSRSFLWSEGLPGTFQCAQTTAASTATAPPPRAASFVPFSPPPALTPPSSCVIRFTPSSFVRQQQRLPATFAVHMSLPSARAAAISWRVRSARINGTDAGARGTFLPPSSTSTSAMPSSLLGGLAPSRVRLSLQPFVFTGDAVNAQHLPAFATGYEAYLAAKVVGSTVSAADLVNETATSAAGVSAATLASPILDVPVEAAAVAFEFATSVAGQQVFAALHA